MSRCSATTNAGRDDLAAAVVSLVEQPSWRDERRLVEPAWIRDREWSVELVGSRGGG
jgi:hypothetical protein